MTGASLSAASVAPQMRFACPLVLRRVETPRALSQAATSSNLSNAQVGSPNPQNTAPSSASTSAAEGS